ncbi:MAG: hypothetical protein Q9191_006312 [Dirinaria sp. TL-2023a]
MSEPIPESIPTSADPRSHRPTKRRALTPTTAQAASVNALFSKPDAEIAIPSSALTTKSRLPAPPEIVANVQGSSAGAGSGEFHVYKASRRREYERVKAMDEEVEKEKADREFETQRDEKRKRDEERTEKNRKKRLKKKGKGGKKEIDEGTENKMVGAKKGPMVPARPSEAIDSDSEQMREDATGLPQKVPEETGVVIHDDD